MAGGRTGPVPSDEEHVYRLPGWTPIRMLPDDEEPFFPEAEAEPPPPPEEPVELDERWDPIAIYLDYDMDEDRPPERLS